MNEPGAFLALLQLSDSFFPSGLFTQSHGLEHFVAQGTTGPEQLTPLLRLYLCDVIGPTDGVALRWTMRSVPDLAAVSAIDQQLEAIKLTSESRVGSRRSGRALLRVGAQAFADQGAAAYAALVAADHAPGHHAVALGLLAAGAGVDHDLAAHAELHAFAVSWLAAAVRLGALDYLQAQALLHTAAPWIAQAAAASRTQPWQAMGSWSPVIDLRQMQHAAAEGRLFAS